MIRQFVLGLGLFASQWALAAIDLNQGLADYKLNCSNSACHGINPASNINGVKKAANKPAEITNAINKDLGGMSLLKGVLSAAQLDNIAAYIDNPNGAVAASVSLSSQSVSYGAVAVGTMTSGVSITVANVSGATVSGLTITNPSADFVRMNGCKSTLAPGASCFINLYAAPRSLGALSSTVTVTVAGNTASTSVALSTTGTASTSASASNTVLEFYNPDLDNFFITSGLDEQKMVESGAVGRWLKTGTSYKTGGSTAVCRFGGNYAANPATGKFYGPNSHFYTIDAGECASLKSLFKANAPSWAFENLDFMSNPTTNGSCPSGTQAIYRAYNNSFSRGIDSNHRFTNSKLELAKMVLVGWADEGVAFCAPS